MARKRGKPKQRLFVCEKEIYINETSKLFEPGDYARRDDLGSFIPHHFVEVDPQSHAVIQTFDEPEGEEPEKEERPVKKAEKKVLPEPEEEEPEEEDDPF